MMVVPIASTQAVVRCQKRIIQCSSLGEKMCWNLRDIGSGWGSAGRLVVETRNTAVKFRTFSTDVLEFLKMSSFFVSIVLLTFI